MKQLSNRSILIRLLIATAVLTGALLLPPTEARAASYRLKGKNAVAGGFGFQVGLFDWAPGGFKWTNEYLRNLSRHVWLNVQFNATFGDMDDRHCWYDDYQHRWRCTDGRWDGNAIELAVGPNIRFEAKNIPLVIDAKLGGAFEVLFFGNDYAGVAFGFRGGVGVHYFLFENLGVGPEIQITMGPAFLDSDLGVEPYGTFDAQIIGVEYRF
jgi:hypothetical protein